MRFQWKEIDKSDNVKTYEAKISGILILSSGYKWNIV